MNEPDSEWERPKLDASPVNDNTSQRRGFAWIVYNIVFWGAVVFSVLQLALMTFVLLFLLAFSDSFTSDLGLFKLAAIHFGFAVTAAIVAVIAAASKRASEFMFDENAHLIGERRKRSF